MAAKQRKCRVCGSKYTPHTSFQKWCSPDCGVELSREAQRKAREAERKAERRDLKKRKEKIKSRGEWANETQKVCNKYIRLRDKGRPCCSCGKPDDGTHQRHASHFRPVSQNKSLRFHEMNIFASCMQCNSIKSGNLTSYEEFLINEIGKENVEWLKTQNHPYTWDIPDLKEIKAYFSEKIKCLERNG